MKVLLKFYLSGGLVVIGVLLLVYFEANGSYINADGFLVEVFWAWGLGVALIILGLVWLAVSLLVSSLSKQNRG